MRADLAVPTDRLRHGAALAAGTALGIVLLAGCDGGTTASSSVVAEIRAAWETGRRQTPWPPASEPPRELDPARTRDNVMLVLDMSGSMGRRDCAGRFPSKAAAARAAFKGWLKQVSPDTNVGLAVVADNRIEVPVPPGRGDVNRRALAAAVDAARPGGETPLSTAVETARRALEARARLQQGYGTYRLVVITDGEHSAGFDPTDAVVEILANRNNPIEIHTIGFCIDDSALNLPGLTYYQSAADPDQLQRGLAQVLAETVAFDADTFEALDAGALDTGAH